MPGEQLWNLTQGLDERVQHGAEERRRALVAEIQSRQHVLDDVGHQRQQAAVRVSQHHRQHPGSLRTETDGDEVNLVTP